MKSNKISEYEIFDMSSKHYNSRGGTNISAIILHCFGNKAEEMFDIFDKYGVSAHFIVPRFTARELKERFPEKFSSFEPKFPNKIPIIRTVAEEDRAYHAGVSRFAEFNKEPGCDKGLNSCSIGIEFHSEGYGDNGNNFYKFCNYTKEQKEVGIALISYLAEKYQIPKNNILAHSTIAPGRKTDPGPKFFWKKLHKNELGYLPISKNCDIKFENEEQTTKFIQQKLFDIGFIDCPQNSILDKDTKDNINAYYFQFAPELWSDPFETDNDILNGEKIEDFIRRKTKIVPELIDSLYGFNVTTEQKIELENVEEIPFTSSSHRRNSNSITR